MTQQGPPLEDIFDRPGAPATGPAPFPEPLTPQPMQRSETPVEEPVEQPSPLDRADDPFPAEFPEGHQAPFQGLLLLGKLEHYFTWVGHRFRIKTCLPHELAEASRWAARFAGTDGYVKAYQAAVIAACLISIDGKPLPAVPLTRDDTAIEANADWVFRELFPPVLDKIHEEYVLLEFKAREILADMGKVSG